MARSSTAGPPDIDVIPDRQALLVPTQEQDRLPNAPPDVSRRNRVHDSRSRQSAWMRAIPWKDEWRPWLACAFIRGSISKTRVHVRSPARAFGP